MSAVINYTNYYLPETFLSIRDFVALLADSYLEQLQPGITREDLVHILETTMGFRRVYVEERKNEAGIFRGMLERYFEKEKVDPKEVDLLIYTRGDAIAVGNPWSMTAEECLNVPYFLQNELKMINAQAFSIEQDFSGTLMAAWIAACLVETGSARRVLLLSRNFFNVPENRLMWGTSLVSDGLGLMEITDTDTGLAVVDHSGTTDGDIRTVKDFSREENQRKVVRTGSDLILGLLRRNRLGIRDIARIIPQNISRSVWNFYCGTMDFPIEGVFLDNLANGGHMGDTDIIRNITDIRERGGLKPEEYAVAYAVGTGTSWNALLLKALS